MTKIYYKNTDQSVDVGAGVELKDIVNSNGWPVPFGCEDGLCGTCIVKVNKGKENLSDVEEKEQITLTAMGLLDGEHRLACQCRVNGDVDLETY